MDYFKWAPGFCREDFAGIMLGDPSFDVIGKSYVDLVIFIALQYINIVFHIHTLSRYAPACMPSGM